MRKVTLTFGLIAGFTVSLLMVLNMALLKGALIDFDSAELIGYGSMLIALSMIFFGIKSFRDNYQNGRIGFAKSFQVGVLITAVASLMYMAAWEIYSDTDLRTSFMDKYAEHTINKMKARGASEAEIGQSTKQMNNMKQMYQNPFIRMGFTLAEILPVGLVVTLISGAILRKKGILSASIPLATAGLTF